jgi:two-component system, cell cycle response regulator DivK
VSRPADVLIVEDNADGRTIYSSILEHAGYQVRVASDGDEALRILGATPPRLVVLDIVLPVIDGWSVMEQMRDDAGLGAVPIICVTAQAFAEHRDRALALGCRRFLPKPLAPRRLLEEIEEILGPPPLPV